MSISEGKDFVPIHHIIFPFYTDLTKHIEPPTVLIQLHLSASAATPQSHSAIQILHILPLVRGVRFANHFLNQVQKQRHSFYTAHKTIVHFIHSSYRICMSSLEEETSRQPSLIIYSIQ